MTDRAWKAFERRLSKDMGTNRIPVTGERDGADAKTSMFQFQFKLRKVIPLWLFRWMDGIVASAAAHEKIGVLVLKRPRMEDTDALVIVRWRDWVDLHGPMR
jgi:hypothetical protein